MNFDIALLDTVAFDAAIPDLAELLQACVQDGASVGFVLPLPIEEAASFWRGLVPSVAEGGRLLLVARLGGRIAGTVQLGLAAMPNGRHRAEINKLLVHPESRRRGIARALMIEAEALACRNGRTLLVLDTANGDAAEPLYLSLGYERAGIVPDYAATPWGVLEATTIMYKRLTSSQPVIEGRRMVAGKDPM